MRCAERRRGQRAALAVSYTPKSSLRCAHQLVFAMQFKPSFTVLAALVAAVSVSAAPADVEVCYLNPGAQQLADFINNFGRLVLLKLTVTSSSVPTPTGAVTAPTTVSTKACAPTSHPSSKTISPALVPMPVGSAMYTCQSLCSRKL